MNIPEEYALVFKGVEVMKKMILLWLVGLLGLALVGCAEQTTASTTATTATTEPQGTDDFAYGSLSFPNFSAINPIRFLGVDQNGFEYDGWQDFGIDGEIQTHPWPWMTYTYQMYSYFIRTNLQVLFSGVVLPENLEDLPQWFAQTHEDGHRILWYSMGSDLPDAITLVAIETLTSTNGIQTFLRAEYEVTVGETERQWIVYFMDVEGTFSSYSVRVNENYETVLSTTDFMVQTYQLKVPEVE